MEGKAEQQEYEVFNHTASIVSALVGLECQLDTSSRHQRGKNLS